MRWRVTFRSKCTPVSRRFCRVAELITIRVRLCTREAKMTSTHARVAGLGSLTSEPSLFRCLLAHARYLGENTLIDTTAENSEIYNVTRILTLSSATIGMQSYSSAESHLTEAAMMEMSSSLS
jgi:hypothetical protein